MSVLKNYNSGFTLIELLVVISIVSLLSAIIMASLNSVRDAAYFARAQAEMRSMVQALTFFILENNGEFPEDVSRDIPPGIEEYLGPGSWPGAPWPGSVYDWDNWAPESLSYEPKEQVYQISIRFCPISGETEDCKFPSEEWVDETWDVQSALYYCIEGSCRSHSSRPPDHPGYCLNCN